MRYQISTADYDSSIWIGSDNKFSLCGELEFKFIDDDWVDIVTLANGAT